MVPSPLTPIRAFRPGQSPARGEDYPLDRLFRLCPFLLLYNSAIKSATVLIKIRKPNL